MGEDQFEVGHFIFGGNKGLGFFEAAVGFDQFIDFVEVGQVIGRGVNFSAGFERAGDGIHEQLIEDTIVLLLSFWPRIRIENVISVHALRRDEIGDGILAVQSQNAEVEQF